MGLVDGKRISRILTLAWPIMGAMLSQTLLGIVDIAMVGRIEGQGITAVAAVGVGGFANMLAVGVVLGLGTGVQALVGRRIGEQRHAEAAVPLHGGLVLIVLVGLPLTLLMWFFAEAVIAFLNGDPALQALAGPYLQVRVLGTVAVGFNVCFRGFWNGIERSRLYLVALLTMHISNVLISYALIFGVAGLPALGTLGAAIGSTIATFLGAFVHVALGFVHARPFGFLRRAPSLEVLRGVFRLSLPTSVQQLLFFVGINALFSIVGLLGTDATAAANVLIQVMLFGILPAMGCGLAANALIGQALGRGDPKDAARWGWEVAGVGALVVIILSIPMAAMPEVILGAFLEEPETVALATSALLLVAASLWLDAVGLILMQAHLGAGASRTSLVVNSGIQWLVFLPSAYVVGPLLGYGLVGIWAVQMASRGLQALVFAWLWRRGSWALIRL